VVALVAVIMYANTMQNLPVFDDGWVIFDNPLIKHLDHVGAIFHQSYGFAAPAEQRGLYRPVTTLSYAVNWAIGGLDVVGYHVGNIALHVLCCLLVLDLGTLLGRASLGDRPAAPSALLSALLFAIHPVHVEAVTAMVGRDEVLAASGALGCLYLTCTRRRASWRYPVALAALAAGVLSKENAAVAPLLFVLIALALPVAADLETRPSLSSPEGRHALGRASALAAGMAGVVGLCVLLRPTAAAIPIGALWFRDLPGRVVFNTMTRVLAEYLRLLVFPAPLGVDMYYANKIPFTPSYTLTCLADTLVWLAVLAIGIGSWRRAPLIAVGILWIFLALLPVLNIIRVGVLMAERLLYLPSVGFCILTGACVAVLLERLRPQSTQRGLAMGVVAGAGVLLAAKTWTRNADWHDPYTLWQAEVRRDPRDPVANNFLAVEDMTRGELDSAGAHLVAALTAAPLYWSANQNAGLLAHRLHHDTAAVRLLARAHALDPPQSDPVFFLAIVRGDEGRLAEAVDLLSDAEALGPSEAWTRMCRGWYLERLGRLPEGQAARARPGRVAWELRRQRQDAVRQRPTGASSTTDVRGHRLATTPDTLHSTRDSRPKLGCSVKGLDDLVHSRLELGKGNCLLQVR
jgi:hypothetical protein